MTKIATLLIALGLLVSPLTAAAQPAEGEAAAPAEEAAAPPPAEGTEGAAATTVADAPEQPEMADERQSDAPQAIQQASAHSPHEEENKPYYFLGARFRLLWIPTFLVNLFADVEDWGGAINPGTGLEFTYRKNNFDIVTALWWQGFSSTPGYMKGQGDQRTEMEHIDPKLNAFYLSADFIWSHPFNDVLAFTYGAGVGVGIVTGSLTRTEAFYQGSSWHKCSGAGSGEGPDPNYCEAEGGQYGVDENGSGGDVPPVVPWIALDLGLRIKPHRNFMMRVDLGVGLGFFLGVSGNYGL